MIVPLLWLLVVALQAAPPLPLAITDGKGRPPRLDGDGAFALRPSSGPFYSTRLYMDFTFAFEVAMDSGTQATVLLRVHDTGASRLQGPRVKLPPAPVAGVWRRIEVVADGKQVTLAVDGEVLARADVSQFVGHVGFQVEKGAARFRQVMMSPIERPFTVPAEVLKAEDLKARGGELPRLKNGTTTMHGAAALRTKAAGTVLLEALVLTDGTVGLVRVVHSLDPDYDYEAIVAVKAWTFSPAMLDGKAVAALIKVTFKFE
jgi:TonB family protein